ncbi:hypothetical protein [Cyanobium sp. AMD-g]|uniref:hypothetical protein n=1 Tax=Cyanobium sp. AMD-g TaxID=2823699 RepID=UPI0020CCC076|nr:hypothetical protein [Cyanobium sp. AMD-g]
MGGVSQYEWSTRWWTAVGQAPAASNPLFGSSDSASLDLINGTPESPVYYLTGSLDGQPINRTARIASNQHIFFSPVNYLEWESFDPSFQDSPAAVCASAVSNIDAIANDSSSVFLATLNGTDLVPDVRSYRQSCDGKPNLSPVPSGLDGGFEASAGTGTLFTEILATSNPDRFASDGYWLMLQPLAAGTYQLRYGGTFNGGQFVQDNTYSLEVYNPSVPGPLPALGLAVAFRCSRRLRARLQKGRRPRLGNSG